MKKLLVKTIEGFISALFVNHHKKKIDELTDDYTEAVSACDALLIDYNELGNKYDELLDRYNQLLDKYDELLVNTVERLTDFTILPSQEQD